MYRRGPQKSTPASVQCQKCLKRDKSSSFHTSNRATLLTSPERHYTYECKATAQERPYVPRPSRTQQLFNPKLVPKLTNEVPPAPEKKEGLADQILAQREVERAKKRRLEGDADVDELPKRQRSASFDSVSTVSTNAGPSSKGLQQRASRSPSPARDRGNHRVSGSTSPLRNVPRARSRSSVSERSYSRDRSMSPERPARNRSFSPQRQDEPTGQRGRDHSPEQDQLYSRDVSLGREQIHNVRRRRRSPSTSMSPPPQNRRRLRSRSPQQRGRQDRDAQGQRGRRSSSSPRQRGPGQSPAEQQRRPPQRQVPRERSLSPFSRRLALTQSMNTQR